MTARIFSINPVIGFVPFTLTGHRNSLVNCFFEENSLNVSFNYPIMSQRIFMSDFLLYFLEGIETILKSFQIQTNEFV